MHADGIAVVGHWVSVRLLLAQAYPGVLRLQVPDRLAPFALEIEDTGPAEPAQDSRVEALASLDLAHDHVLFVNTPRRHRSMLLPL
jgi:hypothetical protein